MIDFTGEIKIHSETNILCIAFFKFFIIKIYWRILLIVLIVNSKYNITNIICI